MVNRRGFVGRVAALFSGLGLGTLGGKAEASGPGLEGYTGRGVKVEAAKPNGVEPKVWVRAYGLVRGDGEWAQTYLVDRASRDVENLLSGIVIDTPLGEPLEIIVRVSCVRGNRVGA